MSRIPILEEMLISEYNILSEEDRIDFRDHFVDESNAIEGIFPDTIGTISIREGESLEDSYDRTFPEIRGHHKALLYVLEHALLEPLSEEHILTLHGKLGKHLIPNAGSYRESPMYMVRRITPETNFCTGKPYYRQVPRLMREFEKKCKTLEKTSPSNEQLWDLHHEFEVIHPFSDGNGRVGRLLLNWLSLRYLKKFQIVNARDRQTYYEMIQKYEKSFREKNPSVRFYKDRVEHRQLF